MQQNRRITDNLLAGGSYAIYAGQKRGGPPTSKIVITGNQISTMFYAHGGHYGCAAHFNSRGRKNVWSDNTWNTTSVPDLQCLRLATRARSLAIDCAICHPT